MSTALKAGDPPYGPNDLTVGKPLTPAQRAKVIAWLVSRGHDKKQMELYPDARLIAQYAAEYEIWKVNNDSLIGANPLTSVLDFLNLLTDPHLWLRVAEFAIGAILIGVGLAKMTSAGPTLSKVPLYGKMIPA